jgi:TonB family protein
MCAAVLLFSQQTGEATLSFAEEPAVFAAVAPVYGALARTAHVGGEVSVELIIDSNGKVKSVKGSSGHPLLLDAAKEASRQWLFAPVGNDAVDRVATVTFVFKMMPRCATATDLTPIFHPPFRIEVRGETPPITCSDCSPSEQEKLRCKNQ